MCKDWTGSQRQIYAGLKEIGGEAAGYFKSALTYYYDASLSNRVSHLAHAAREIDGGLRDIFSPESLKRKIEENLIVKGVEKVFGIEFKDYKGHIASILVALDVDEKNSLAQEWVSIATKFAKYAHRSGIWKTERSFDEFKPFWDRYEKVLSRLVGSYYAVIERIDRLINLQEISYASAGALLNLLKNRAYSAYFFGRVKNISWFNALKESDIFNPARIQNDRNEQATFSDVLPYLEYLSTVADKYPQLGKELIDIIQSVVQYSNNVNKVNDCYIWWSIVKILNNIPATIIKKNITIEKFHTWLDVWTKHSMGFDLTISDIGEKLLPKFLADGYGPEYKYAETIIDTITEIKAGGNVRGITRREDAVLAWDSYWIRDAFKKHSQLIGEKCSIDIVFGLADKLRRALEYKQKNYYANVEIGVNIYQIWISRINKEGLSSVEIGYKEDVYECIVRNYSEEQLKNIDRKNDFWALHNIDAQIELKRFTFAASTKDLFARAIRENLPANINWQASNKFDKKIINLYEGLFSDYSHIWCRTLQSGPEHGGGAEDILTIILRDVLFAKCKVDREGGKQVLDSFLMDNKYQFPIFRRFVLLCVDRFWAEYSEFLDRLIEAVPGVLEESDLEVEMQDVLQNHNSEFSSVLKVKLKALINNIPEYYVEKGDKKQTAYWKFKWLSPIRENSDFKELFKTARQEAEIEDGKHYESERSTFRGGFVSHKAPISKEDILQKSIAELVKYLADFKGADFWHGTFDGEPDKEGLADVLQVAVKDNPKKFTDDLDTLMTADYFYLHRIFRGLKEAWNVGIEIDWENIFDFSIKYFSRGKDVIVAEALKAQGEDSGKGRYIWIVEAIVELIGDGSRDDKRAFDPKHFDKAEQIFDLMLPLLRGEKKPDMQRDALTYALNTTLGRTIMAYVSFSLRVARATQKKKDNWGRDKFERFLPIGIDGYIWFGCYLPQMKYLDESYRLEKINSFAQKNSSDFEWQMFMEGYLTGASVYKELYLLMRPNYLKALGSSVFNGRADERLVEHICIGYLQLDEALTQNNADGQPSLFWKMLNEVDADDKRGRLENVAGFFWSISGRSLKKEKESQEDPSEDFKNKILAFWKWTVEKQELIKNKLGEKYSSFLSRMAELTIWLDKIDAAVEEWLMLSAPFIEIEHRSAFFIEYLTKFDDDESIKRIGKIFLKVLKSTTPTFKQEEIQVIVERLYKLGEEDATVKQDADNICNTYGRRGIHFLRDLFYKNQK